MSECTSTNVNIDQQQKSTATELKKFEQLTIDCESANNQSKLKSHQKINNHNLQQFSAHNKPENRDSMNDSKGESSARSSPSLSCGPTKKGTKEVDGGQESRPGSDELTELVKGKNKSTADWAIASRNLTNKKLGNYHEAVNWCGVCEMNCLLRKKDPFSTFLEPFQKTLFS